MAKRMWKKAARAPKGANVRQRLRRALGKRKKDELVELIVQLAEEDRQTLRRIEAQLELETPADELVAATRQAIDDATAFDERDINRNFDFECEAYAAVKRNLARLIERGQTPLAMELALELMDQGSYQVAVSDEGMMAEDIRECLKVVIGALRRGDQPAADVLRWCAKMADKDRVGFLCDSELLALRRKFEASSK